jgi:hypothetical protein
MPRMRYLNCNNCEAFDTKSINIKHLSDKNYMVYFLLALYWYFHCYRTKDTFVIIIFFCIFGETPCTVHCNLLNSLVFWGNLYKIANGLKGFNHFFKFKLPAWKSNNSTTNWSLWCAWWIRGIVSISIRIIFTRTCMTNN